MSIPVLLFLIGRAFRKLEVPTINRILYQDSLNNNSKSQSKWLEYTRNEMLYLTFQCTLDKWMKKHNNEICCKTIKWDTILINLQVHVFGIWLFRFAENLFLNCWVDNDFMLLPPHFKKAFSIKYFSCS